MKHFLLRALLGACTVTAVAVPVTPAAAMPVFDATNYGQNLLQAARALQQIDQQIQQLRNEATLIQQQARNLARLDFTALARLDANFRRVDQLLGQARGIGFRVSELDERFRAMFPGADALPAGRDGRVAAARARLDGVMDAFLGTIGMQAQVAENIQADSALLAELVGRSQDAAGSLQAQQAGNQLTALAAQQQLQLQALLAAQFRVEALAEARRAQAETDGATATRRFLGTGRAYTPH